ncbi:MULTISPECIES: NRAMP family divalent metal transporter [unclassified Sediminibacterium]|uniref:NRAMP family divalent metal transporter n=1 Tax=unclassified Sediminibacterium TaxID=2635961 RepID=UPI0025F6CE60|nr:MULTISPECIES: NRAMP family divalent metal transporter [unclassified Sediminibacterium]
MKQLKKNSAITGAAFLMATSAIGPGFLTQTTVFTQSLLASFGFVILISVLLDIIAQLNIWRILAVTGKRAQDIANEVVPGLGYVLSLLIVLGGLAFNIGNIGGCGLGLNVLTGLPNTTGALISCGIALFLFWMKEFSSLMDSFTKVLGILMILLTLYVAISSTPPVMDAIQHSFIPEQINAKAIVTLVGGTVGGYICFAGGHRLLDAGLSGVSSLPQVSKSAVTGICVTAVMRIVLFLAVLGVVSKGYLLDSTNPPASVFKIAAGELGYRFFGVVMWCAAITSVVGAAYTSVSFLRTFHSWIEKNYRVLISVFIVSSTMIYISIDNPVSILVTVGALNGLILPVALAVMLIVIKRKPIMGYKHSQWLSISGWMVVLVMIYFSIVTIKNGIF